MNKLKLVPGGGWVQSEQVQNMSRGIPMWGWGIPAQGARLGGPSMLRSNASWVMVIWDPLWTE